MKHGEFLSVRQAAIASGLVKKGEDHEDGRKQRADASRELHETTEHND
jgi:hypothetical protein